MGQNIDPLAELRSRLHSALILELRLVAPNDLAHRRPRHRQRPHDLLDCLMAALDRPKLVIGRPNMRSHERTFSAAERRRQCAHLRRPDGPVDAPEFVYVRILAAANTQPSSRPVCHTAGWRPTFFRATRMLKSLAPAPSYSYRRRCGRSPVPDWSADCRSTWCPDARAGRSRCSQRDIHC